MPSLLTASIRRDASRLTLFRLLRGWHLCSLDAPTIAVVWAALFARQCGSRLALLETAVLLLGAWLVYVLDRLLDAAAFHRAPAKAATTLQDRHRFHHAHRSVLIGLCAAATAALAALAANLPRPLLALYFALSVPVATYAAAVHTSWSRRAGCPAETPLPGRLGRSMALLFIRPRSGASLGPPETRGSTLAPGYLKEAVVALLFASAVAAPAATHALPAQRFTLLLTTTLFALLCWLNCLLIGHSEAALGGLPQTRGALALGAAALALLAAGVGSCLPHVANPCAAIALAALLLLTLLHGRPSSTRARRVRVLADLALLTPVLFLLA